MSELNLDMLWRSLRWRGALSCDPLGSGQPERRVHVTVEERDAILAALQRIPELKREIRRIRGVAEENSRANHELIQRAERMEAALRHIQNGGYPPSVLARRALAAAPVAEPKRACPTCDGCGQVADTENQEPWTAWTNLPLPSSAGVLAGLVKPIPCPACAAPAEEGSGG